MPSVNKQETQKFCFSMNITVVSHMLKCTHNWFTNNEDLEIEDLLYQFQFI